MALELQCNTALLFQSLLLSRNPLFLETFLLGCNSRQLIFFFLTLKFSCNLHLCFQALLLSCNTLLLQALPFSCDASSLRLL